MYTVVRFVEEIDNRLHVIPAEDILNFDPCDENDFDKDTYTAQWEDPTNDENSGEYVVQILLLAGMCTFLLIQLNLKFPPTGEFECLALTLL